MVHVVELIVAAAVVVVDYAGCFVCTAQHSSSNRAGQPAAEKGAGIALSSTTVQSSAPAY